MRILILLLAALISACASKAPREDAADVITRYGVIVAKEAVAIEDARRDTRTRTSVHASVSTGGRVSIGIGVLFSQLFSGSEQAEPVRYEVRLIDGGEMTIYHDSHDFEVDDCVEIRVYPDERKNPPTMQRSKDACG